MHFYTAEPYGITTGVPVDDLVQRTSTFGDAGTAGGTEIRICNYSAGGLLGELVDEGEAYMHIDAFSLSKPQTKGVAVRVNTRGRTNKGGCGFIMPGDGWREMVKGRWRTHHSRGPDSLMVTRKDAIMEVLFSGGDPNWRGRRYVFAVGVESSAPRVGMFDMGGANGVPLWAGVDPAQVIQGRDLETILRLLDEETEGGTPRFLLPRTEGEFRTAHVLEARFIKHPPKE
jgi:hypothetical protein